MRFLNIVFIALTLVFITPPQILAQSTPNDPIFVCGNTADNTVLPITPPCVNNTPWDNLLTYRPYDQNAPVLWVKVNFIFLQTQVMLEPDGRKTRGNFDFDIPEDEAFVKNAVADMNARIRDINIPVNPDCFNPNDLATGQHILNGKIQFDVAYYFVEDGYLWDIGNMNTNAFYCPTGLNGWVNGIYGGRAETMLADEGIRDGINIIFGQEGIPYETIVNQRDFSGGLDGNNDGMIVFSEFASSTDCSQLPSLTDFDQIQWVAMNNEYFAYRYKQIADESSTDDLVSSRSHYDVGRVLLHELGHSLGIPGIAHVTDCTENVMSSAGGDMNYLTPSQLGVFHHRLHLSSARRHVVCEEPGITPRRITNDETWAFNTKIYNDIIVESGAELRICGELFMPKDGSIIVERGARLVVDGGRISIDREELENCPEVRWSGILVNGNPDRLHANVDINNLQADDPGVVIIENGALIERAAVAVAASADRRSFQYATSTPITTARAPFAGGIIRAHNSTFLNNTESVRIDNYRHANRSLFTDCVFDTDSDSAEVGINAYRVHSFLVLNCDFSRMNGSGIALNQAPIDISGGNLFEFCQIGVYAVGYNFFGINTEIGEDFLFGDARTRFLNNAVGVHIGNVNGVEIINNGFTDNSTGVIISGESIFTVNKNTFLGGSQATRYEQTGFNNLNNLLCNVYNETGTAAHFIGDNRSVIINGNDFSRVGDFQGAPNRDINLYPAYNDGTVSLGRLKIQGGPNDGRRNRFRTLSSGNNVSRDIVTYVDATSNEYQTVPFTYFALADQAQIYEPECTLNVPCQNETNNYFMQVVLSGNAICTGISPPDGANEACEDIACLNGKYTTIDNLNTQWDGGNTATYRNALQSSGNGNYALYNSINQQSPLISEKILQMLIAQSWINTNTKAQLLSANVPLSKATLDAASGVLSTPQMDSIYIQQNTNPQLNRIDLKRAVLEAEQRKNYGLQTLVSTLYQNNDLSGAQSVLTNDGSELAQRLHIDLLLWTEDSTAAHNLLNAYTNTGIDADDYEQMTQYALAPPIFDGAWDNATHADLTYRAEQDGLFAGLAQSLLLRHERIFFLPDLTNGKALKEDPVSQRTDKIAPAERKRVMSNESMRIMPNPARDLLHLILPVDVPTNVRVYNLQGKLLKAAVLSGNSQLDVNGLPRGVVIVRLEHPMHKQTIKLLLQ